MIKTSLVFLFSILFLSLFFGFTHSKHALASYQLSIDHVETQDNWNGNPDAYYIKVYFTPSIVSLSNNYWGAFNWSDCSLYDESAQKIPQILSQLSSQDPVSWCSFNINKKLYSGDHSLLLKISGTSQLEPIWDGESSSFFIIIPSPNPPDIFGSFHISNNGQEYYYLRNFSNPNPSTLGDTSCSSISENGYVSGIYDSSDNIVQQFNFIICSFYQSHGAFLGNAITGFQLDHMPAGTYHALIQGVTSHKIWRSQDFIIPNPNPPYSINGMVYIDANQNGIKDLGESGYVGAVINLITGQSVITDENGQYTINDVDFGVNLETLILPNGYTATTYNPVDIAFSADEEQDFGIIPGPSTVTLTPVADSYIKQGSQNENEGASLFLRLQSTGRNRTIIKFDHSQIQSAIGNSQNYTVKLRLKITDNGNNWGANGRTIETHRLIQDWIEGNGYIDSNHPAYRGVGSGSTWNCSVDLNISNQNNDCSGISVWNMDNTPSWPFNSIPTSTQLIQNNQSGVVEFDVTSDVQSFMNSSSQDFGWLIKKTDEGQNGKIQFGSRESSNAPELNITKN